MSTSSTACQAVTSGIIKFFCPKRLFGWIQPGDAVEPRFFHYNDVLKAPELPWVEIPVGSSVAFEYGEKNRVNKVRPLGEKWFSKPRQCQQPSERELVVASICATLFARRSGYLCATKNQVAEYSSKVVLAKVNKVKINVQQVPDHDCWRKERLLKKVCELEKMQSALQTESGIDILFKLCGQYCSVRISSNGTIYAMELQKLFLSDFALSIKEAGLLNAGVNPR